VAVTATDRFQPAKAAPGERVVLLRGWPGCDRRRPPPAPSRQAPRLWQRNAIVVFAAARLDRSRPGVATPERLGLAAALVTCGPSVSTGCVIVGDDLAATDELGRLQDWAATHALATTIGPRPWQVATLGEFFDPGASAEGQPWAFTPNAYSGAGFCIGADLGRTFGLAAEHCSPRRGQHYGGWELWLPGWGRPHDRGRWKRVSPHRPPLRLMARRVGWQVEFGPCEQGNGKQHQGRVWRGDFVDVMSLGYALDADRGASFAEHCADFGVPAFELPLAVDVDPVGAEQVTGAVAAIHALAVALDEQAGRWFTTSRDRAEGRGRVDLARTSSPGALAAQVPARSGVRPPLDTLAVRPEEHRRWVEAFHGGWCDADVRLLGVPFAAAAADVSSCYPLVAHRLGWWDLTCAGSWRRDDVTGMLRRTCARAVTDPGVVLDPKVWHRFRWTLVEVKPGGERYPVWLDDKLRPDGRLEVGPLVSSERSFFFAWPDVVAAAVLSRRVPDIVRAVRYTPGPAQKGMRRQVAVLPGLVPHAGDDPAVAGVRHRRKLKKRGDTRLAGELRVVANSLVSGNPARFDDYWRYQRRTRAWTVEERPGPWTFFPVASSVPAGARLLLAVLDRLVADLGGLVAYRDTDSSLIPAGPQAGQLTLADGTTVRSLSWAEIDGVLAAFARLSPEEGWPVWKVEHGAIGNPLRAVVFGPKRHAEFTLDPSGRADLVDATEAQLGGTYCDPAAMPGRAAALDGYRAWSMAAVRREVDLAVARTQGGAGMLRVPAPWDRPEEVPFPALRRLMVKTPEMAKALPAGLGARIGTRYLQAEVEIRQPDRSPVVTLDPGGDLAGWQELPWLSTTDGRPVPVTTDDFDAGLNGAIRLATLDEKGVAWSRPSRAEPVTRVTVRGDRDVRYVGRVSGLLDAADDGQPGDLSGYRPAYRDADGLGLAQQAARELGKRRFARVTGLPLKVAERAALGRPIAARSVARALHALPGEDSYLACACGCGQPVRRGRGARYVDATHRERAKKRRQRTGPPGDERTRP
jgi:hypothetical protein